jgi:hypothetical protein
MLKPENRGVAWLESTVKRIAEKNPDEIAFLMLEKPVSDHVVVPVGEKERLEAVAKSFAKKLSLVEILGYRVEINVNSHRVFTIKIARKDRDLDSVVYMKIWDPKLKAKVIAGGGWVTIGEKWYWGQYIAVDLSYAKNVNEKELFEFVKKIISLVI